MIGNSVLADTNIFIEIMKGNAGFAQKLEAFSTVFISPFVHAELFFGAYRSANPVKHLDKVATAVGKTKLLTVDAETAIIFVRLKLALFAKGRPVPENDIWIAATAVQHNVALFTNDAHFQEIKDLQLVA